MTIKLPTSFRGIDGKEAYERIMKKKDPVPEAKTKTTQSNLENVLVFSEFNKIFVLDNTPNAVPIEIASRSDSVVAFMLS